MKRVFDTQANTVESKMADFKRLLLTESSCTQCSAAGDRNVSSDTLVTQVLLEDFCTKFYE